MTDEQKKNLEQKLWAIANDLRGKMDADEFRDYILGFIFYKYLSERMQIHADRVLAADGIHYLDLDVTTDEGQAILTAVHDDAVESLGFHLNPEQLFHKMAGRGFAGEFIIDDLHATLSSIEQSTIGTASQDEFGNLFEEMDLNSTKLGKTPDQRNKLISKVLTHLDGIDFRLDDAQSDVLGDAYEYMIGKFASGAGKSAGEFYTPQEVSTILAGIVTTGKSRLKSVYDPTCGSGSLLLRVAREVPDVGDFYGQELTRTTYNLARMNMILHGVSYRNFHIAQDDTLEHPQHLDLRAEAIVANPPFSAKWTSSPSLLQDERFAEYGKLAPANKADFAFIQHMLYHLDDNGTMAVVLPHGVLFRSGAEAVIRRFLIEEKNCLDAVIGLPGGIFYGTSIETAILVFRKCRENDDVLFIDASQCFEKGKNKNQLRAEDIDHIIEGYRERADEERFSRKVRRSEIASNDWNLNIPRYVDTREPEEIIDLKAVAAEAKEIDSEMEAMDSRIRAFCGELGLECPL